MATKANPLQDLFRQQTNTTSNADEAGLTSFYEVILKVFYWTIDHIPYINTYFKKALLSSMDSAIPPLSKSGPLTQLSAYNCTGFTQRQIDHIKDKVVTMTTEQIEQWRKAPDHALCYTRLGVVSNNDKCTSSLYNAVYACFHLKTSIHLGIPKKQGRPALSPDFLNVCVITLPRLPITELFIHGPIKNDEDREKLNTIVSTTRTLATVHFKVGKTSAEYFTAQATGILDKNQTITAFNLTLMGNKKQRLKLDADLWTTLNEHPRCNVACTNIVAPNGFIPGTLSFQ